MSDTLEEQKKANAEYREKTLAEATRIFNQFNHLKFVTTVGVYPNFGNHKINGVPIENLEAHIFYNLSWRVGRALIINNCVVYEGCVDKECLRKTLEVVKDIKLDKDTQPYV